MQNDCATPALALEEIQAMKLGYTIVYVPSVTSSLQFFGQAFGLETRFLHESGEAASLSVV
jgi:hypothetical protein